MENKWSGAWPRFPGQYWFFGHRSDQHLMFKPGFWLVTQEGDRSVVATDGGDKLYLGVAKGIWAKAEGPPPPLPQEPLPPRNKSGGIIV